LEKILEGLRDENTAYIYHAHDHYFILIGYDLTPQRPVDAYKPFEEIDPALLDHWLIIGEPAKFYPTMHIKRWKDIEMDLKLTNPQYFNIREPQKGVMSNNIQNGGSCHCIMKFRKSSHRPKEKP